ncbi:unnamed protein product, partial [marine sediment metagenome]
DLQITIFNLESDLGTSNGRIETANSEIQKLTKQLDEAEADRTELAKLRQRVTDLQTELTKTQEEAASTKDWETSSEYAQFVNRLDQLAEQLKMQRRLLQQLREGIKGDPKYDMLFMLQDIPGGIVIQEIARAIGVPSGLALRYAMDFEKQELVKIHGEGIEARVQSVVAVMETNLEEPQADA